MLYEDRDTIREWAIKELLGKKKDAELARRFSRQWFGPNDDKAINAKAMLNLIKLIERLKLIDEIAVRQAGDINPLVNYWLERLPKSSLDGIL